MGRNYHLFINFFIVFHSYEDGEATMFAILSNNFALKENGGVHRCVFASITVKAPVREVWNVLTSYEALPE